MEPAGDGVFRVRSARGDAWYRVDPSVPECTCVDFGRHRDIPGFACKHLLTARAAAATRV